MGIPFFCGYDRSYKRQTSKKLFTGVERKNNFFKDIGFIPESGRQIMICIPITAGTNKEALKDIEKSCLVADFIELRMDLIEGGVLSALISAARSSSGFS